MLAEYLPNSFSLGTPSFTPSWRLMDIFERALLDAVPEFLNGLITFPMTRGLDESGFSQEFVTALNRTLFSNPKGIIAVPEYRDYFTCGANPVKRVDIAFVPSENGTSKSKLYTVEAKRLPTGTGVREQEYVYGHFTSGSPSGGIQRFKTGDHGYGLPKSAILGYVEQNDFQHWHTTINNWITDKASELPDWDISEQIQDLEIDSYQNYSASRSKANRLSDSIDLFHLWIKIP